MCNKSYVHVVRMRYIAKDKSFKGDWHGVRYYTNKDKAVERFSEYVQQMQGIGKSLVLNDEVITEGMYSKQAMLCADDDDVYIEIVAFNAELL